MNKYLSLEKFDGFRISSFSELSGFIVGDPFCEYRMNKYGNIGMIDLMSDIYNENKEIIYHTPVYITDRNFNRIIKMIEYMIDKYNVQKIIVQDVGLANWVIHKHPSIIVIWGHWGKNRNSLMNHDFIEFLIKIGVSGIEISTAGRIIAIKQTELPVYAVYGNTEYNSVSRECYNSYMINRFHGLCERECISNNMVLQNNSTKMTIDGHILGRRINYPNNNEDFANAIRNVENLMIYSTDSKTAIDVLKRFDNVKDV